MYSDVEIVVLASHIVIYLHNARVNNYTHIQTFIYYSRKKDDM